MNILDVERILRSAGQRLANGLYFYWPSSGDNELPEANLTIHTAASLVDNGFIVNAEAHSEGSVKTHLDLLGINPSTETLVGIEYKRLISAKLRSDIERLLSFKPQPPPISDPRLKITNRFGVAGGTTWKEEYATWWDSDLEEAKDPTQNGELDMLAGLIPQNKSAWGNIVLSSYIEAGLDERVTQWFLYVIFPIS